MSSFAGSAKVGGAGPGVCGKVAIATQAQTYYATPYGVACPYVPSVTNLLLRRQAVQTALFTVATGSAPNARGTNALDIQANRTAITEVASGALAVAVGNSCRAAGSKSVGMGYNSVATTNYSVAIGRYCQSITSNTALSVGISCNSKGFVSVAMGQSCKVYSTYASAFGFKSYVGTAVILGNSGSTFGYQNRIASTATTYNATALGYKNVVNNANNASAAGSNNTIGTAAFTATHSCAFGFSNTIASTANSNDATAVGVSNTINGSPRAIAIGTLNQSKAASASSVGVYNNNGGLKSQAFGYQNQIATVGAVNFANAFGYGNLIAGASDGCNCFGTANTANYLNCSAFGRSNTVDTRTGANAFGASNVCRGASASAFGTGNLVGTVAFTATSSCAFGSSNKIGQSANADYASAFGINNQVYGSHAIGFGYNNIASALKASTFGYANQARAIKCTCLGYSCTNTAGGTYSVTVGTFCFSSAASLSSVAVGVMNNQTGGALNQTTGVITGAPVVTTVGINSVAVGVNNNAQALRSVAIGVNSVARIQDTSVLQPPIIAPKTNGIAQANAFAQLSGIQNVLYTVEIDFTAAAATQTITLPAGARFFIDAVGVIVEELDGSLTTQISYEFGITGTLAKTLGITAGVALNVKYQEEKWTNLLAPDAGESSLTFRITTPGVLNTATLYKGKAFWIGRLIETE